MKQQQCHIELFRSEVWFQLGISELNKWHNRSRKRDEIFVTFNHVCRQNFMVCLCFVCLCLSANVCVGETHAAPVLYKWPPCLCGFVPGATDAWIMWCRALGATSAQPSWDHLSMWPSICIKWRNGFASSRRPSAASAVRRRRARDQPPCRRNQVLSVWLGTAPSISAVGFPLPGIKSAQGNTSALMTGRQDKQSSVPKFCHACLLCKRNSDDVFIATSNWFGPACDKTRCSCSVTSFVISFTRSWLGLNSPLPTAAEADPVRMFARPRHVWKSWNHLFLLSNL